MINRNKLDSNSLNYLRELDKALTAFEHIVGDEIGSLVSFFNNRDTHEAVMVLQGLPAKAAALVKESSGKNATPANIISAGKEIEEDLKKIKKLLTLEEYVLGELKHSASKENADATSVKRILNKNDNAIKELDKKVEKWKRQSKDSSYGIHEDVQKKIELARQLIKTYNSFASEAYQSVLQTSITHMYKETKLLLKVYKKLNEYCDDALTYVQGMQIWDTKWKSDTLMKDYRERANEILKRVEKVVNKANQSLELLAMVRLMQYRDAAKVLREERMTLHEVEKEMQRIGLAMGVPTYANQGSVKDMPFLKSA